MKKKPLSKEEHENLAKDLVNCQKLLEPWMDRFYDCYPCRGKECRQMRSVLNLLSSKICDLQDNHWYKLEDEGHKSPYYGPHKNAWI